MHLQPSNELEALSILKPHAAKDPDTVRKLFQKFKENNYDALRNQYAAAKKEVADSKSSFEVIDQGTMTDEQKRHLDIQKTTETNASGHFFLFSAGGASKTTAGHVEDESITRVVNNFQKKTGISLQHVENTNLYMPVQAEVKLVSSESAITEGMVKNRVTVVNGRTLQSIAPIQVNGSARNVVHRTAAEQGPQPEQELDQNRLQLRYQLKRVSERREADSKRVRKILSRLNEGMDKEIAGTFGKSIETSTGTIAPAFDRLHSQFQRSHGIQDFIYAGKPSEKSAAEPFSDSKATTLLSDYRGHLESLESLMKDIKQSLEVRESRSPGAEALRKFLKVELDWIEEAKQFYVFTPV